MNQLASAKVSVYRACELIHQLLDARKATTMGCRARIPAQEHNKNRDRNRSAGQPRHVQSRSVPHLNHVQPLQNPQNDHAWHLRDCQPSHQQIRLMKLRFTAGDWSLFPRTLMSINLVRDSYARLIHPLLNDDPAWITKLPGRLRTPPLVSSRGCQRTSPTPDRPWGPPA